MMALLAGGLFGLAIATVLIFILAPRDRTVAVAAAIGLVAAAVAPVHLVPTAVRFAELGAFALLCALVIARRGPHRLIGPAVLVAVYLGLLWSSTRRVAYLDAAEQFLMHAIIGLAFVVFGVLANSDERRIIARCVIGIAVVASLYGMFEFAAGPGPLYASAVPPGFPAVNGHMLSELVPGGLRSQATFGHPLLMAMWLLVGFALAMRFPASTPRRQTLTLAVIALGVVAVGSRSALAVIVVFVLFTIGAQKFSAWRAAAASAAAGALVLLAPASLIGVAESDASFAHRFELLDAVPRLLTYQDSTAIWWGNGWASRDLLYARGLLQTDGFVAVDNQVVSLLSTAGLIGLAVFAAAALTALVRSPFDTRLALGAALLTFLTFDVLEYPGTWALLAVLLGFGLANRRQEATAEPARPAAAVAARSALGSRR